MSWIFFLKVAIQLSTVAFKEIKYFFIAELYRFVRDNVPHTCYRVPLLLMTRNMPLIYCFQNS